MNPQDTQAMYDSLDAITEGTGLNVKTTKELLEKDGSYNPPLSFDAKLDEILNRYGEYAVLKDVNQFDNVSMEREFPDLPNRAKAKQAIKQLIADEMRELLDRLEMANDDVDKLVTAIQAERAKLKEVK